MFIGEVVPPDSTLVFDVHLLDVWNRADLVVTKSVTTPKDCKRSVMRTDFVRYHFNGTLLDGTVFDSRCVYSYRLLSAGRCGCVTKTQSSVSVLPHPGVLCV